MTHVEHLLTLIAEGEALRDQMRKEMEVMADIISRQNETAKSQGAMLVKAEAIAKAYKHRMEVRDNNMRKVKRKLKHFNKVLDEQSLLKKYIREINNGEWPKGLC